MPVDDSNLADSPIPHGTCDDGVEVGEPHLDEALKILHDTIEGEDFQPCFDQERVGGALLGNLNRVFDAVLKVRDALVVKRALDEETE